MYGRTKLFRISQAGKQKREMSSFDDAIWIGGLMQQDNVYDTVYFEEERRGEYVPCGRFEALCRRDPDAPWRGNVFGSFYCREDGVTRRMSYEEEWIARSDWSEKREAAKIARSEYLCGRLTLKQYQTAIRQQTADAIMASASLTERDQITGVLRACGFNIANTARQLGLPRTTLISRMDRLNILTPEKMIARDGSPPAA